MTGDDATRVLSVRWLGRVPYREALAVQEAVFASGRGSHLLLLEHDHVFTHGPSADLNHRKIFELQQIIQRLSFCDLISFKRLPFPFLLFLIVSLIFLTIFLSVSLP